MINLIKNFLQIGNNTQINNIIINSDVKASIEHIKNDFNEGKFEEAIKFLDKLIIENEKIKQNKYYLLLLKIDFLRQFGSYEEFEENLTFIEKSDDYKPYHDNKLKELKLALLSMNRDVSFFELSKQLRIDTPNSKPQGHFDLVFYMNSGELQKAKEIFEEEIKNKDYEKHLYLLGGHIYSTLYKYGEKESFKKADYYYKKALEESEINYLDKFAIQIFYGTHNINHFLMNKSCVDFEVLREYENFLINIFENKEYFSEEYIFSLVESYINILLILDKQEKYFEIYEQYKEQLPIRNYFQYCEIKNIACSHTYIQEHLKSKFDLQDLLIYCSLVKNKSLDEIKQVINFLNNNENYIYKDAFILYCFVSGYISTSKKLDISVEKYLEENKYKVIDSLLAYMEYQLYLSKQIDSKDIDKLLEFCNDCIYHRLIDTIKFLQRLRRTEYLQLALFKENEFEGIIYETLIICENDKDLLFDTFHEFVEQIQNKDNLNFILGRIYSKYNKLNIAFNYFYNEYKNSKNINAMLEVLNTAYFIYSNSGEKFEYQKQKEVFNSILAEVYNFEIKNLLFLLSYEITLLQSVSNILPILNQKLLEQDISKLDNDLKINLSNIFIQTEFISNYKDLFLKGDNLCFVKDGISYVKNNYDILEENQNNYGFRLIDDNDFFLKISDDNFVKSSLFHRIVGPFVFRCDNPMFIPITIDETKKEPLEDLFKFMKNQTDNTKDLFQRYSDGKEIGLFPLSQSNYKNYFELIPFLLKSNIHNFNAGKINYKDKSINTILTFSSIVFLNHIGYLEKVLKRKDVFIQRTLINWLREYLISLDVTKMPIKFDYIEDPKPVFYRNTKEEIEEFKISIQKLIKLILENCADRIIDDHLEILPIKGSYEILAKHIGSQEFQAFSFAINKKFQIITEDTIYNMMFDVFKYNKSFISNSLSLLEDILSYEELRDLRISLFSKKYKYVFPEQYILSLVTYMKNEDITTLQSKEYELIRIVDNYGWLEEIKRYYVNKFSGKYVKVNLPVENNFDVNIEFILQILENNDKKRLLSK
ncbi:hypothetical protein [Aliarcobacter butzleri]|uniref:hypothetical protein n=1 Tax=Aliarcobacter butzleri TaxID=28197 RepID=UPI0021B2C92E|nr:hypothetical protein [Aliarcobacter butzleri]MCT7602384.1 hypothetical protein [Aliarcobacter butzleri]